jgi:hypothetical protein
MQMNMNRTLQRTRNGLKWDPGHLFNRHSPFAVRCLGLLLVLLILSSGSAQEPQSKYKRLILKDGSYELISQCQIRGDRVRYFSSERNDWEELPTSLIDWPATEKYAAQSAHSASEQKGEALERAAAERREEEAHSPTVAPGIRLPSPDGAYMLDVYQNRQELNPLAQNGADLNRNTGRNILRAVINPIAGPRQTIELKGLHARIQSHTQSPSIYFPIDPGDPGAGYDSRGARDHLRIVGCRINKGNRVVVAIDIAIYGKVKQKADYIDIQVEPVSDYWVRVTPGAPLKPGEYALVEFDGKGAMNQYVWDFGVNPAASANPDSVESTPDRSAPVLIQKPRKKPNQ